MPSSSIIVISDHVLLYWRLFLGRGDNMLVANILLTHGCLTLLPPRLVCVCECVHISLARHDDIHMQTCCVLISNKLQYFFSKVLIIRLTWESMVFCQVTTTAALSENRTECEIGNQCIQQYVKAKKKSSPVFIRDPQSPKRVKAWRKSIIMHGASKRAAAAAARIVWPCPRPRSRMFGH